MINEFHEFCELLLIAVSFKTDSQKRGKIILCRAVSKKKKTQTHTTYFGPMTV